VEDTVKRLYFQLRSQLVEFDSSGQTQQRFFFLSGAAHVLKKASANHIQPLRFPLAHTNYLIQVSTTQDGGQITRPMETCSISTETSL